MEKWIYGEEDFHTGRWSGGTETEFAIFPQSAQYLERDFIWRLSSVQALAEESSFARLADYERVFMALEGEAVLAFGDQRTVQLLAQEQDAFDGAAKIKCFGKMKGYSLMVRKGCSGKLRFIDVGSDAVAVERDLPQEASNSSYGFYCLSGYVVVSAGQEAHMVSEGKQMVLNFDIDETIDLKVMGEGQLLMAEVFYRKQDYVAEEIPPQKATLDDFKTAFKLSHSRYKWHQIVAVKKDVWYDEALQRALAFLDRSYLGIIIWAVVCVILLLSVFAGASHLLVASLIAFWSVLYLLLVSPFLYMLLLPKPIKAHIKKTDSLTEYERKLYEQELFANPLTDKIFKKYKYSGKKKWDEDYRPIFKRLKK